MWGGVNIYIKIKKYTDINREKINGKEGSNNE